jgi:hypothetical protein
MGRIRRSMRWLLTLVLGIGFATGAYAGTLATLNIERSTGAGGGQTWASGGALVLGGTFGQHDAAPASSGGALSLTGGFWSPDTLEQGFVLDIFANVTPPQRVRIGQLVTYTVLLTPTFPVTPLLARGDAPLAGTIRVTATIPSNAVYVVGSATPAPLQVLPTALVWDVDRASTGWVGRYTVRVTGASRNMLAVATANDGVNGTQATDSVRLSTVEYAFLASVTSEALVR